MRKLFKTLALSLALVLPFAAFAQEANKKTTMKVGGDASSPNVEWTITAEEEGDGIFVVTFDGAIKEGYHGYAMKDMYSAPMFEFEGTEVVGDVVEPLTSLEHPDAFGTSYIYYHQAIYQYKIKASAGANVPCYISATICTNETNQCTVNTAEFNITMPVKDWSLRANATEVIVPATEDEKEHKESGFVLTFTRDSVSLQEQFAGRDLNELIKNVQFECNFENIKIDTAASKITNGMALMQTEPFVCERGTEVNGSFTLDQTKSNFNVKLGEDTSSEGDNTMDWSNIWSFLGQAIMWGLLAIVTPCVFPMVPMTVSFFVKGSQSPAQGRFRASMYGIFIVVLYVLPIAALVLLSNVFGTNIAGDFFNMIGTHWIPNLLFFAIFMVFAASFFGAFEITMPSKLVNKSDEGASKGGLIGIFFMALTLVLVSFSCTGPIVGTVIINATSSGGNVWVPVLVMAAFAITFALPFTVLAWFPSLLKNLPKSGGWLNSVKVVLGFIEVALGLKFLMTADQTMHWGLLDREIYLAIWIVTFTLLGFYLLGKLRFAHDDKVEKISVFRLTLAIGVFSFVVYMIPGMFGAPLNGISGYIPPMSTQDYQINGRIDNVNAGRKYAEFLHLPYQLKGHFDFDEAVEDAKAQNKPIFIDVTGHACNNCREMETRVWGSEKVLPMLQNDFIICALYVDDNTKVEGGRLGSINSAFAQERWGVNSQPGYILLSPDGETVLAGPYGYDANIEKFVQFLNSGKNANIPINGTVVTEVAEQTTEVTE